MADDSKVLPFRPKDPPANPPSEKVWTCMSCDECQHWLLKANGDIACAFCGYVCRLKFFDPNLPPGEHIA